MQRLLTAAATVRRRRRLGLRLLLRRRPEVLGRGPCARHAEDGSRILQLPQFAAREVQPLVRLDRPHLRQRGGQGELAAAIQFKSSIQSSVQLRRDLPHLQAHVRQAVDQALGARLHQQPALELTQRG